LYSRTLPREIINVHHFCYSVRGGYFAYRYDYYISLTLTNHVQIETTEWPVTRPVPSAIPKAHPGPSIGTARGEIAVELSSVAHDADGGNTSLSSST
jgi:hypothetical protein